MRTAKVELVVTSWHSLSCRLCTVSCLDLKVSNWAKAEILASYWRCYTNVRFCWWCFWRKGFNYSVLEAQAEGISNTFWACFSAYLIHAFRPFFLLTDGVRELLSNCYLAYWLISGSGGISVQQVVSCLYRWNVNREPQAPTSITSVKDVYKIFL